MLDRYSHLQNGFHRPPEKFLEVHLADVTHLIHLMNQVWAVVENAEARVVIEPK